MSAAQGSQLARTPEELQVLDFFKTWWPPYKELCIAGREAGRVETGSDLFIPEEYSIKLAAMEDELLPVLRAHPDVLPRELELLEREVAMRARYCTQEEAFSVSDAWAELLRTGRNA